MRLLGLSMLQTKVALTSKKFGSRSVVMIPYKTEQAIQARDALARALYYRLFNWMVQTMNESLNLHVASSGRRQKETVIGILDIFGFEIFR